MTVSNLYCENKKKVNIFLAAENNYTIGVDSMTKLSIELL